MHQAIRRGGYGYVRFSAYSRKKPFADGLGFYKLFWVFLSGGLAGVGMETLWALCTHGVLESRAGVLYGPFNPLYGFGLVLITVCLVRFNYARDLWLMLGGMLLGGGYEYLCSLLQEFMFGSTSWDYSGTQLNLGGRTNLLFCFIWGLLGMVWVKDLYPVGSELLERVPRKVGVVATWVLALLLALDMGLSILAVSRQEGRREGVPATNAFTQFLDRHYPDSVLERVYPNMKPVKKE